MPNLVLPPGITGHLVHGQPYYIPRRLVPDRPDLIGTTFAVREPWRLALWSWSSAVVYADGRQTAGYTDLPHDQHTLRPTFAAGDLLIQAIATDTPAAYSNSVLQNLATPTRALASIAFQSAILMPDWAVRWQVSVKEVGPGWVRVVPQERIATTTPREWTLTETRRMIRLQKHLEYLFRRPPSPARAADLRHAVRAVFMAGPRTRSYTNACAGEVAVLRAASIPPEWVDAVATALRSIPPTARSRSAFALAQDVLGTQLTAAAQPSRRQPPSIFQLVRA